MGSYKSHAPRRAASYAGKQRKLVKLVVVFMTIAIVASEAHLALKDFPAEERARGTPPQSHSDSTH